MSNSGQKLSILLLSRPRVMRNGFFFFGFVLPPSSCGNSGALLRNLGFLAEFFMGANHRKLSSKKLDLSVS
jgi:hypothetical protein